MSRMYKSSTNEVLSESEWRLWADSAWERTTSNRDPKAGIIKPVDSFERIKKILQLTEIKD